MTAPAIHVNGLGKRYHLGARGPAAGALRRIARTTFLRSPLRAQDIDSEFWALRDVSFDVRPGVVTGVIGANGAGKSTLLKILARITEPTTGRAELRGRVRSLLEVGTGFHPDLTGRENIYLNGAILGLRKREIDTRFDQIVQFAETSRFLDTPVKRYSSGMYVRLAFAVAAHLEPEILLVDEVLAVGDAAFQKRCLGRMHDVATQEGRTVLFVSHNMQAVRTLCHEAVLLEQGRVRARGPANHVVDAYLQSVERRWKPTTVPPENSLRQHSSGDIRVLAVRAHAQSRGDEPLGIDEPLHIDIDYANCRFGLRLVIALQLYSADDVLVLKTTSGSDPAWHGRPLDENLLRTRCSLPAHLLNDGHYRVRLTFFDLDGGELLDLPDALFLTLHERVPRAVDFCGRWPGLVRPRCDWTTLAPACSPVTA